jgi:Heterokaryon incompatibility protein (HET)
MDFSQTRLNRISYWAGTPAYRSALRPTQIKHSVSQDATAINQISDDSVNCYKYRPLDVTNREIRLIHLLPRLSVAEDDHLVSCRIEHASLDDDPTYLALSYTWGPEQPTQIILLEGKRFQVRENLAIVLRQLQHQRDELVLWVDAICINQEAGDKEEKGEQIRLMGAIFGGAAIVLAWLGAADAANDSDIVMETLDRLGKACVYSMPRGSEFYDVIRESMSTEMATITLDHVETMCQFFRRD